MLTAFSSFLLFSVSGTAHALPQQPQAAPVGPPQTIVVVGDRIADLRRRLAACLARHCPPNEDIDATTALAELLFDNGEYRDARSLLLASIGRNRRQAAHYPEPVSDLYRANALVARHLGFDADARLSTWEILHSLQRGIPVEDARHFTARLEVIESLIAFGEYYQARQQLNVLANKARAAGRDDVVAATELRGIWLHYMQDPHGDEVIRELTALSASTNGYRSIGARMLLVRIYNARGQTRQADALIAQIAGRGTHRQLLSAPEYELVQQDNVAARAANGRAIMAALSSGRPQLVDNLTDRMTDIYDQLIDVAFRIRPDGTVVDVQIVNHRGEPGWAPPLIRSISGRRYAVSRDGSETYRVERYSYTAERRTEGLTSTHISNRSPRGRVEYRELSETNIPPTPATPRTGSD
jgi:hypothetical protein